jgi:hypothetical protein
LTIDPGVTVQFDAIAGNKLNVQGALVANGTVTQTITLTGVVTSPGSWGGISAIGTAATPAHVNLNYVTLDYGGASGSYGAQLFADQAVVSITHSLIVTVRAMVCIPPCMAYSTPMLPTSWVTAKTPSNLTSHPRIC